MAERDLCRLRTRLAVAMAFPAVAISLPVQVAQAQLEITISAGATLINSEQLEQSVGRQLDVVRHDAEVRSLAPTIGAAVAINGSPFQFRFDYTRTSQDFEQYLESTNPLMPEWTDGQMIGDFYDFRFGYRALPATRRRPSVSLLGGLTWANNLIKTKSLYPGGLEQRDERSESGLKATGGIRLGGPLIGQTFFEFGADYSGGGKKDVDRHWRVGASVGYGFKANLW